MSQPPAQQGQPRWTFISVALFIIGLLILIPAGLCTLVFGVAMLSEGSAYLGEVASSFMLVLLVGGVPAAVGALLVWAGWQARSRD